MLRYMYIFLHGCDDSNCYATYLIFEIKLDPWKSFNDLVNIDKRITFIRNCDQTHGQKHRQAHRQWVIPSPSPFHKKAGDNTKYKNGLPGGVVLKGNCFVGGPTPARVAASI